MMYNLNFWPEVDWKREGSMDPRFVMGACLCLLVLAIAAIWSVHYGRVLVLRSDLAVLRVENAKIEKTAEEVTRKNDCVAYWNKVIAGVKGKNKTRMPVSRQLSALAAAMPDSIILSSVSFRSQTRDANMADLLPAQKKGKSEPVLLYECILSGVAVGADAEKTAAELSQTLSTHPEIAPWVDAVQLTNIAPDAEAAAGAAGARTRFTLAIQYNPLDWYNQ